jgi:dynein heavy chain 1
MENFLISLDPPIEQCQQDFFKYLHEWINIVCTLSKIKIFNQDPIQNSTFKNLILKVDPELFHSSYQKIYSMINEVESYTLEWVQYQTLWDLDAKSVFSSLKDINDWCRLLQDVLKERKMFDTPTTLKHFEGVSIDYGHIMSKINAQYDIWQRELVTHCGLNLESENSNLMLNLQEAREYLEKISFNSDFRESVFAILRLNQYSDSKTDWENTLLKCSKGEKMLTRFRFRFPCNWIYYERLAGEYSAFAEIFQRKQQSFNDCKNFIIDQVLNSNKDSIDSISKLISEWETSKPVNGDSKPMSALKIIDQFQQKFTKLRSTYDILVQSKAVLNLDFRTGDHIVTAMEEIQDIKSVLENLVSVWQGLDDLQQILWKSESFSKLSEQLDHLLTRMISMPNRMRQYSAFQSLLKTVRDYSSIHAQCKGLKSESLRDRHWILILNQLKLTSNISLITVGNIWNSWRSDAKPIEQIISTAQGEMALEEFLSQVRATWQVYNFEFINFQNKCRLIKNWDDLFTKSQDHLTSISAMKNSFYFKAFKDEALSLEDSLSRLYSLLDQWVLVQKKWVYLQGIFNDNQEIKRILPMESSKFSSVDIEFNGLLKKVYRSPLVFDVVNIPNIDHTIQRLNDLLAGVQKSLGEYLERERCTFPRFYFLADEELLEILGNSKDMDRIQPHLKKMFAGINRLSVCQNDSDIINGVLSREGEYVQFVEPVSTKDSNVNIWLEKVCNQVSLTLYSLVIKSLRESPFRDADCLKNWLDNYPAQVINLTLQLQFSTNAESLIKQNKIVSFVESIKENVEIVAHMMTLQLDTIQRSKCEAMVTQLVHQRDIALLLKDSSVCSVDDYQWMRQMRYYVVNDTVRVHMADQEFTYGFEYLGIHDMLVQTPLTDRCFLTLCQALGNGLGGSPYGPAGTGTLYVTKGKTESVKALASKLGRHCLVFCCDEGFDFQSIGRIFVGLSCVGAWGCFDEFNRLEEKILSAVSQQVQSIQSGIKNSEKVELIGKMLNINPNTGIFITMNPGYAGRSALPDNLVSLFRGIAMSAPDKLIIAQVLLFSQGFKKAKTLASKIVPFFDIAKDQFSHQRHYDFGLRALKSVLSIAGKLKRRSSSDEETLLIQSVKETVFPKLVQEDVEIAKNLLFDLFGTKNYTSYTAGELLKSIEDIAERDHFIPNESWIDKVIQLNGILEINHGVMLVGKAGSGKTCAWRILFKALETLDKTDGVIHVFDPKSVSKDILYGSLDSTTREWTDGIFTKILRNINDDVHGQKNKRHWIVFDGDVDPEWIENLNSVLDDNKTLTLPNGERLPFPSNVRILFEVESVEKATPATVSRCGMIWFPKDLISISMMSDRYLAKLRNISLDTASVDISHHQLRAADLLKPLLDSEKVLGQCILKAASLDQVMQYTNSQILENLFSLIDACVKTAIEYDSEHDEFPLVSEELDSFFVHSFYINLAWSLGGNMCLQERIKLGKFISRIGFLLIPEDQTIFDFETLLPSGQLIPWRDRVTNVIVDPKSIHHQDVVIPTVDTLRHEKVIYSWLAEHRSVILCGPPGSGKVQELFI